MHRAALAVVALLLVASQAALVVLAQSTANAKPVTVSAAMPIVMLLAIPGAVGWAMSANLERLVPTPRGIAAMLAAGLAMRLVWFWAAVPLEDDYFRYLWDGALVAHGLDPYAMSPEQVAASIDLDPTRAAMRADGSAVLAHINFPDLRTIYPAVAEAVFALAHWLTPWRVDGLRILLLLSELCTVLVLLAVLVHLGGNPLLAALYWLNPLVVFVSLGTVHIDALLPPLLLSTVLALAYGRSRAAAALLGLAVGIKVWPVLLAPLVAAEIAARDRRSFVSAAAIFLAVAGVALGPLLASSLTPSSGLAAYSAGWSINNGPYAWASYALVQVSGADGRAQLALRAVLAGVVAAVALLCMRRTDGSSATFINRAMAIAAVLFYLSPAQFPWYALWFLPFAAAANNRPLLLACVTLPAYYLFFPLAEQGRRDLYLYGLAFVHSAPVWAALAWSAWRPGCDDRDQFQWRSGHV